MGQLISIFLEYSYLHLYPFNFVDNFLCSCTYPKGNGFIQLESSISTIKFNLSILYNFIFHSLSYLMVKMIQLKQIERNPIERIHFLKMKMKEMHTSSKVTQWKEQLDVIFVYFKSFIIHN